jgi:acyl transferase domain-containing protein/phosphopantetheinyl transferase
MAERDGVAIVGMACVLPGAPDLATYWRNVQTGVDAIEDVPRTRWDPVFYDPTSSLADRFYCKRGGFVDAYARFDAAGFGVMPVAAEGAEPDQLMALDVATRALADAGYADRAFPRARTGVILGRGNYAGAGRTRLEQHVRTAEQLVRSLRMLLPDLPEADLLRVKREFQAQIPGIGADAAIGLVPNLTASRLSNRLDLGGPAFTVDAACASSLVAVEQASSELSSGRCDMVLCGGVHLCHDEAFWSVFCQLGALSRSQQIRPFDRRADGILIGEGVGVVVLKRLADAERDGDRVYAVIRGTGTASDGRAASLMTPAVEGQLLALERAWRAAGLDPRSIGLLEAHGTGTSAGDAAEVTTLRRFFGDANDLGAAPRAGLGSVKSMIGHTMPAAGIAGLIKAALAVHHGVLPPTLHCEEPVAALEETRFRAITRAEPWERDGAHGGGPRRAAVNAFGFGGINAHVVLEEHAASGPRAGISTVAAVASSAPRTLASERVARFASATRDGLLADLARDDERGAHVHGERLAILDPTPARRDRARVIVEKGRPWRGREGIWFSPKGLLDEGGRVALLFPGVDASFEPRVDDVAARLGLPLPACTVARNLEEQGIGIIGVNRLVHRALRAMGVEADLLAGHSIGEWSGMIASGMLQEETIDAFIVGIEPGSLDVPGVVFAAAGCSVERATAAMAGLDRIAISHDNCPHQILFCGQEASVDVALGRLVDDGVLCQKLPFQSGFHSPLFESYLGPHRENFGRFPIAAPHTAMWSATNAAPYPHDSDAIRALAIEHLVKPVRFRETIEALHAEGARVFVQCGTGSLVNFVEDTLRGRPHVAIAANVKERSGLEQLRRVAAALYVEGADLEWSALMDTTRLAVPTPSAAPARASMTLALGVPLVQHMTPLARPSAARAAAPAADAGLAGHPLASAFATSMEAIGRAQADVLAGFTSRADGGATALRPREVTLTRTLSIETFPELIDHSFFRQAPGWTNLSDLHPVVPMTTLIGIMMDAAEGLCPSLVAVGLEDVRAFRWLAISTPVDARITCKFDGVSKVHVAVEGYCEGTVHLADAYPPAPVADATPLVAESPAEHDVRQLYDDRWMFHGPQFQGVVALGHVGDDGIRGVLEAGAARGALLDNAGQLFGYWVMVKNETNRMAMPVKIDAIRFHGPPPRVGDRFACTVRIVRQGERDVVADISLARDGVTWCTLLGWEDRRFDTDARLWPVMLFPEKNLLAEPQRDPAADGGVGLVLFADRYRSAPTRDQLARRYLGEAERAQYEKQGPRGQRAWLSGRIAAKDAVRDLLWSRGHGAMFPAEITITNDDAGRPLVRLARGATVRISIAHKEDMAVALASDGEHDVGVDLEKIEPRSEAFASLSFSDDELRMITLGDDRDEQLTRMWAAKEAVGKARGTGLQGNPRRFTVRDRVGERLLVDGTWVETRRHGEFILGWTYAP